MDLAEARALFPILEKRTYLITGAVAPANTRAVAAVQNHLEALANDTLSTYPGVPEAAVATEDVRRLFAELMHADPEEIAITEGASAASNIAVDLIEPTAGGNVVFDEFSYPSSVFPWMLPPRSEVERRCVQPRDGLIHVEDMQEAIDDRTVAVSVSHVSAFEGFKHDVAALAEAAHAHGAVLIVDGTQAAGAMPVDLHGSGVDFYISASLKWLLGTSGVGFLYVAQKHLDRVPSRVGYTSTGSFDIHNFQLVNSAQRFELGFPSHMGLAYVKPGLEIVKEVGLDRIESQVCDLAGRVIAGLKQRGLDVITPEDPQHRHGIVGVYFPEALFCWLHLRQQGVDVGVVPHVTATSADHEGQLFRVDPHFYNTAEDIDRFFEELDGFLKGDQRPMWGA